MRLQRFFYFFVIGLLMMTVNIIAQTPTPTPNEIEIENALAGTREWQIPTSRSSAQLIPRIHPNSTDYIEAYASATSVEAGDPITFYVNAPNRTESNPIPTQIRIFRMGWYGGDGARRVHISPATYNVSQQVQPEANRQTGLLECNWTPTYTWTVPAESRSGVYLAKIIGTNRDTYSIFVVKNSSSPTAFLMQLAVTTYQAYNYYPHSYDAGTTLDWRSGKSLYPVPFGPPVPEFPTNAPHRNTQARMVSFNRPYFADGNIYQSAGQFFAWEYNMVRWLEKEGHSVSYITDIDTHKATDMVNGIFAPGKHQAFINAGHDEYWSWQMRQNLTAARDRANQPINIGFFGSNDCHWQIRLEPENSSNPRTIVSYKLATNDEFPFGDPVLTTNNDPADDKYKTDYWRENQYSTAENELLGIMTDLDHTVGFGNFKLYQFRPQWITNGTTLTTFLNVVGYEPMRIFTEPQYTYTNRAMSKIAESRFNGPKGWSTANSVYYRMVIDGTTRGRVFSMGTNFWAWGIEPFPNTGSDGDFDPHDQWSDEIYHPELVIIMRNMMNCLKRSDTSCEPPQ